MPLDPARNNGDLRTSHRRYWTLAADPARFRVIDSVRDQKQQWWLTSGRDLRAGDRVGIWKYKSHEDHRGLIAFGEVLTDPELHDVADEEQSYWIDPSGRTASPRVLVHYVIKLAEPLWLDSTSPDSVIRQLPVSRAQGGTAHQMTPDQWAQLMVLVGGWPGSGAAENNQVIDWTDAQIHATITEYFAMLRAELAGQAYVKAEINRHVQAATGRARGAVEFKFQNISAVLTDLGLPYVQGYKPLRNLQRALRTEVERYLAHDAETQRRIDQAPAPDLPSTAQLLEVDPPVMIPPGAIGHRNTPTAAIDYLERQARNQSIGLQGEHLIVEHERRWLTAHGRPDLAEMVTHIPTTLGDGAGYDIGSYLPDGQPHHIEVKTTRGSIHTPFFLSSAELRRALARSGTYAIYRVFDLGPDPKFYRLTGDITRILDLTPVSYQARVISDRASDTIG